MKREGQRKRQGEETESYNAKKIAEILSMKISSKVSNERQCKDTERG